MRKLVLGLFGATALTAASAANATLIITTPTSVSVSGPSTIDNINFTFGYSDSNTNSPFTETVSWMNDLAGIYGLTLTTIAAAINGPTDVDITAAFVTGTGISGSINLLPALGNNDLVEQYFLAGLPLGAGTYTLTVRGTRGDSGSFGGNVAFQAGAVPEPGTWGLMLVGFGALGWQLRRRRGQVLARAA
jgi:PEP-CTERM motif-containing protein